MPGDQLDLNSDPDGEGPRRDRQGRRFIGIRFTCCEIYTRVYLNRTGTAYEGRCPRCLRTIAIKVGPGGTDQRFFTAG